MKEEKIEWLYSLTDTLDKMSKNEVIKAQNKQRVSVEGTVRRIKDVSSKRFSLKRVNDDYFTITRIR
jgi:hypothetical protein